MAEATKEFDVQDGLWEAGRDFWEDQRAGQKDEGVVMPPWDSLTELQQQAIMSIWLQLSTVMEMAGTTPKINE